MVSRIQIRDCFSCKEPIVVRSEAKENAPVAEFKTFAIRPPSHHGKQGRFPVIFERVVCPTDNLPSGGSSIGDTVFVCKLCFTDKAKGFRKKMAEIFLAKLRSRSVNLIAELFNSNIISVGPSSAGRLQKLRVENLFEILGTLQQEQKDDIMPELIFALFESGVVIFTPKAKEVFESLDHEQAEFISLSLASLLSDVRTVLPSPVIENLVSKLACLLTFLTAPDEDQ